MNHAIVNVMCCLQAFSYVSFDLQNSDTYVSIMFFYNANKKVLANTNQPNTNWYFLQMGSTLTKLLSASDQEKPSAKPDVVYIQELCYYMYENLIVLNANLSADHFTKVMDLIFDKVVCTIADLTKIGLEVNKILKVL